MRLPHATRRAGLVACTGSRGCKFSASDTKTHAAMIADHVERRVALDQPVNIHLTGCHHSCAQHYIGDIGLLATKVDGGNDSEIEGYHVYLGGGYGPRQAFAREIRRNVPAEQVPLLVERMLAAYLKHRTDPRESFQAFAARRSVEDLRVLFDETAELAA
jgi:ferredoxin-nitrite reductase